VAGQNHGVAVHGAEAFEAFKKPRFIAAGQVRAAIIMPEQGVPAEQYFCRLVPEAEAPRRVAGKGEDRKGADNVAIRKEPIGRGQSGFLKKRTATSAPLSAPVYITANTIRVGSYPPVKRHGGA
jgi:hypothetical protein